MTAVSSWNVVVDLVPSFTTVPRILDRQVVWVWNHSLHGSPACRTVVRVIPISIGNGTFGGPAAPKPLNRST